MRSAILRLFLILFFTVNPIKSVYAMDMDINPNTLFTCQLTADTNQSISQGIWVTYSITNTSAEPVFLLPWNTPLEGFMSKLFIITDEQNNQLSYQGPMVKRSMPTQEDFIVIASGETISTRLDLKLAYHFEKTQYQLSLFTKEVPIIFNQQSHTIQLCQGNQTTINVI